MSQNPYRALPKVDDLLKLCDMSPDFADQSHRLLVQALREDLELARGIIRDQQLDGDAVRNFYQEERFFERLRQRIRERQQRVYIGAINATGVVLHTGLGRAILSEEARQAILEATGFTILEVDRKTGQRNRREDGVMTLLRELTGAPGATVVNNNAAATVLALSALAHGREVIVARGQLVEIGGSFRIPDIMEQSGAKLVEVGATNKVHLYDYERAITENTALILRVHCSNFRIQGFTSEVPVPELVELGRKHDVPVMDDLGSGAFFDLSQHGLPHEPLVQDSVDFGSAVITFSGDKLLGGPQAGLIVGHDWALEKIRKHPLYRAMRPDKLTLAALEASLALYRDPERARERIPVLRMLTTPLQELDRRAHFMAERLAELGPALQVEVIDESSKVGGGAYAVECLPTKALAVNIRDLSARASSQLMRTFDTPIFVRQKDDRILLDLRTILESQQETVIAAFASLVSQSAGYTEL